jgi:hypothetical protein
VTAAPRFARKIFLPGSTESTVPPSIAPTLPAQARIAAQTPGQRRKGSQFLLIRSPLYLKKGATAFEAAP